MERIEGLEQEHRDLTAAFRFKYDGRQLMREQQAFRARLSTGERETVDTEELLAAMQALGATFGKGVS